MKHSLQHFLVAAAVALIASGCVTSRPSYGSETTARALAMTVSPTSSAHMAQFEYRRRLGIGHFLTAEVLRANDDLRLEDLLRMRIPGFANARDPHSGLHGRGPCMNVYLNGLPSPSALDGLRPRDLAGVEYYEATTVPPQFQSPQTACPALLLWTLD